MSVGGAYRMWQVCVWKQVSSKAEMAVYKSYVRPAIAHGSEAWCLKESEMRIMPMTERSTVRSNVWSAAQRQRDPW